MDHKILHILIIDDDEGDRKQFERVLKQAELCECVEVASIREALFTHDTCAFDCAIVDYQMPEYNGLYGITVLRERFPDMPIIMSTGHGNETIAAEAIKHGASDYLIKKNLNADLLRKSIIGAIEKFQFEKKLKEQEIKIEHIAYHDYLTDIPNRLLFEHALFRTIIHAKRNNQIFAVMFLDLDQFKNINDTLGHVTGDLLLKQVTFRFQSVVREEDMLARLGGDEFGVLISKINTIEDAGFFAKKLIESLKNPFLLEKEKINITPSIGIAIYPFASETVSGLMQCADKAMYQAKNAGKNTFQFYTSEF